MIRCDSFGANSGVSARSRRRFGARTTLPRTGTAANCGGNASNLNRFESLVVFLRGVADRVCLVRHHLHDYSGPQREGVSNLWVNLGCYRTGSHTQIFFGPRTFEFFSPNQGIQTARASASSAQAKHLQALAPGCRRPVFVLAALTAELFSSCWCPGAGQISGAPRAWTAWGERAHFREIGKLFF